MGPESVELVAEKEPERLFHVAGVENLEVVPGQLRWEFELLAAEQDVVRFCSGFGPGGSQGVEVEFSHQEPAVRMTVNGFSSAVASTLIVIGIADGLVR